MRFVIDHQQSASGLEAAEHAAQHLVFVLAAFDLVAVGAELAVEGRALVAAKQARQELVIVGDDQPVREFVKGVLVGRRYQRALLVVVAGGGGRRVALIRQEDIEAVADGDAGGEDQEVIDVAGIVAIFAPVEIVVEDQAGHDHGLAAAGGHLEGHPRQLAGGVVAGASLPLPQLVLEMRAGVRFLGDLVEPDRCLDGFLLREEQFLMRGPFGVDEPVVEQIAGDAAGDPPIA